MLLEHLKCSKCGCTGIHACMGDTKAFEEQFDKELEDLANNKSGLQLVRYTRRTERKQ